MIDLDLEVAQGEIFGFLGPNGAGKSTTIRLLMDMIRPTRGTARILGCDTRGESVRIKTFLGYLPGELPDFGRLRGGELIAYMAGLRGVAVEQRVKELSERFSLDLSQRFREYSRGNKQMLGLVLALMHDPQVVILDEPTGGLDPLMQQEFYSLVRAARDRGATVFLSSHVLSEVESICDRAAIIRDARLVRVVELAELRELRSHRIEIEFGGVPPVERLKLAQGVGDIEVEGWRVRCTLQGPFEPLINALAGAGVLNLTSHEPTLEETFLALYRSHGEAATP